MSIARNSPYVPDTFASSRRKIARAKEHIVYLERETGLFFAEPPYSVVVDPDPNEPKHEIHKLRFNRSLPDSLADLTADAIYNLRSALDNIGYGLAVSAGMVNPKYTAFPFAGSAIEFENGIKGRCKDIPGKIHP